MMNAELYQYLILHKQLDIPGIGRFEIEKRPADVDFASRVVNPPIYNISFRQMNIAAPPRKFFNWLEGSLNISEMDAVRRFNDFVFDLKNKLTPDNPFHWKGIGTLKKWPNGEIMFDPIQKGLQVELPVIAKKVIRGSAEHKIIVGENERSSTEMIEFLSPADEKRSYWWAIPLAVAITLFIFIAIYFSSNSLSTSSAANQQKLVPQQANVSH